MGISFRGKQLVAIETPFLALDLLVVGLRLWVRKTKRKPLELNDYMIILGLAFTAALYATEIAGVVAGGGGFHLTHVLQTKGPSAAITYGKITVAADLLWNAAITSIKISILHLYITIFANRAFRRLAYILMAACLMCGAGFMVEEFLICRPLSFQWDKSIHGDCGSQRLAFMVPGIINLALDILIIFLPMPMLWNLQMKIKKKMATSAVFGIGIVICILCAVRLKYVLELDPSDPTWTVNEFGIFGAIEPLLGIISACLPVLPPVLQRIRGNSISPRYIQKATHGKTSSNVADQGWMKSTFGTESSNAPLFSGLDDHTYPLIDLQNKTTRTIVADDLPNTIRITTDWNVHSQPKADML